MPLMYLKYKWIHHILYKTFSNKLLCKPSTSLYKVSSSVSSMKPVTGELAPRTRHVPLTALNRELTVSLSLLPWSCKLVHWDYYVMTLEANDGFRVMLHQCDLLNVWINRSLGKMTKVAAWPGAPSCPSSPCLNHHSVMSPSPTLQYRTIHTASC